MRFLSHLTKATLAIRFLAFTKIPLMFFCRPKVLKLSDESVTIKIPFNRKTKNHLGSMYFGAMSIGADLAGGYLVMHHMAKMKLKVSIIFKDFHADFLKRAEGDVHFICDEGEKLKELVDIAYKTGERQSLPIHIKAFVPSISMDSVATFILTLSLKKK